MEIRLATSADAEALKQLAQRDSAVVPEGELLLAFAGGRALVAMALASGKVIADPFEPTESVVAAVRAYASGPHRRHGLRLEPRRGFVTLWE